MLLPPPAPLPSLTRHSLLHQVIFLLVFITIIQYLFYAFTLHNNISSLWAEMVLSSPLAQCLAHNSQLSKYWLNK